MTPSSANDESIAAVVVLYRPDATTLKNIHAYSEQVGHVYAIDNTEQPTDAVATLEVQVANLSYVWLGGNLGIASALNVGCNLAQEAGFTWALTMDQDSTAGETLVADLLRCAYHSESTALVCPDHIQEGGKPRPPRTGCRVVESTMTSGNLLRLDALAAVGGFDDELFIDQVDNDLCLRLWDAGFEVVESGDARLLHRVGAVSRHVFPVPAYASNHSPVRRYYIARNRMIVGMRHKSAHPAFFWFEMRQQAKDLVKIVLFERAKLEKLKMSWRGYRDYRRGITGAYPGH